MEWKRDTDLIVQSNTLTCCNSNQAVFVCVSRQCNSHKGSRLVCNACSLVHANHMKELIRVQTFIEESSDRHDTAMRLQDYSNIQGDNTNEISTVSYFDTVILQTLGQQKREFVDKMSETENRVNSSLKRYLNLSQAHARTKQIVFKLDKHKGLNLMQLPTKNLQMIIEAYWQQTNEDSEDIQQMKQQLQPEIIKILEQAAANINGMLQTVGTAIDKEVDRLLARVRVLVGNYNDANDNTRSITKYKEQQGKMTKEKKEQEQRLSKDQKLPVNRSQIKETQQRQQTGLSINTNKPRSVSLSLQSQQQQHQEQQQQQEQLRIQKGVFDEFVDDLVKQKDYIQTLNSKIEEKRSELDILEGNKQNGQKESRVVYTRQLKAARNQLHNLINVQLSQEKSFQANKVRLDSQLAHTLQQTQIPPEEIYQCFASEIQVVASELSSSKAHLTQLINKTSFQNQTSSRKHPYSQKMVSSALRYSKKNSNLDSPSDEGGCKSGFETSTSFYQPSPIKVTSDQPIGVKTGILRKISLTARDISTEKTVGTTGITATTVLPSKQTGGINGSKNIPQADPKNLSYQSRSFSVVKRPNTAGSALEQASNNANNTAALAAKSLMQFYPSRS